MKYVIDVEVTGYECLSIEANSLEEAMEKASDRFDVEYMHLPITTLRNKSLKYTHLNDDWE